MKLLSTALLFPLLLAPTAGARPCAPLPSPLQTEEVAELVSRGRAQMRAGQLEQAVATLEQADSLDDGALRTRMWLIRAMIERNYLNDALDLTDEISSAGAQGPDMDYLYGMAFAYKAKKYIREGVNLGTVGMHFGDALTYLGRATEADGQKYADAFLPLAEAAWNSQELDTARAAAQRAVEVEPRNALAALMLGEVAFSQFVVANGDEQRKAEAEAHGQVALEAFERATKLAGDDAATRARAHKKAADVLVWTAQLDAAAKHYASAMGLDPASVDYGQILNSLGADPFLACLEQGSKAFSEQHPGRTQDDATLLWWLGWSRFTHQDYPGAEQAFGATYEKWPAYMNCKWYLGLCAFHQQDFDHARELLLENFALDPADLANSIRGNLVLNTKIVEYIVGQCAKNGDNLAAGKLSESLALAAPEESRFWNNAGLFYRDTADLLGRAQGEIDEVRRGRLYEKALACYESALALEPQNPNYLNDTAVVLHYNLDRDLERALELYARSLEFAVRELERSDLDAQTRADIEIARRDSKNNRRLLEQQLEKRRKQREEAERKRREDEERKRREQEEAQGGGAGR